MTTWCFFPASDDSWIHQSDKDRSQATGNPQFQEALPLQILWNTSVPFLITMPRFPCPPDQRINPATHSRWRDHCPFASLDSKKLVKSNINSLLAQKFHNPPPSTGMATLSIVHYLPPCSSFSPCCHKDRGILSLCPGPQPSLTPPAPRAPWFPKATTSQSADWMLWGLTQQGMDPYPDVFQSGCFVFYFVVVVAFNLSYTLIFM